MSPSETLVVALLSLFDERWKVVPGWPAYQVSTWGRVKSFWKRQGTRENLRMVIGTEGRLLKHGVEPKTGHLHYTLGNGIGTCQKTFKPAQLVLMAFDRPPGEAEEARHIFDPNPENNHLWNLAWGSKSENHVDKVLHGNHPVARLTPDDVAEIRRMIAGGMMQKDVAVRYGVSRATICRVHKGLCWSHVKQSDSPA